MMRTGLGALLGALTFWASVASAEGLSVNPIRLEFGAGQRSSSITVSNDTNETKILQASVVTWRQSGNESVYEPAKDVLATPALFRIPPKSHQLVRVGYAAALPDTVTEHTYRVYLEEVPEGKSQENQVRFMMRFGVPMFVPPAKPQDSIEWQLSRMTDGKLKLAVQNKGNRHVRMHAVTLTGTNGAAIAEIHELAYVLTGSSHEWVVEPGHAIATNDAVQLRAESGRGTLKADLKATAP